MELEVLGYLRASEVDALNLVSRRFHSLLQLHNHRLPKHVIQLDTLRYKIADQVQDAFLIYTKNKDPWDFDLPTSDLLDPDTLRQEWAQLETKMSSILARVGRVDCLWFDQVPAYFMALFDILRSILFPTAVDCVGIPSNCDLPTETVDLAVEIRSRCIHLQGNEQAFDRIVQQGRASQLSSFFYSYNRKQFFPEQALRFIFSVGNIFLFLI